MALTLTIDATDRTSVLIDKTLTITKVRDVFEGRCDFTLKNLAPSINDTVEIAGDVTFSGHVVGMSLSEIRLGRSSAG